MNLLKDYRSVALIEIFVCICFMFSPTISQNGELFNIFSFCATGILFSASLLAFIEARRWKLWLLCITMSIVTVVSIATSLYHRDFLTTGFPLIAYNVLFIVANLHFLGKGLLK